MKIENIIVSLFMASVMAGCTALDIMTAIISFKGGRVGFGICAVLVAVICLILVGRYIRNISDYL
jgi:hypothetical protein